MNTTVIVSLVATSLAALLARETRLRRALEALCTKLVHHHSDRRRPPGNEPVRTNRLVPILVCLLAGMTAEAQAGWFSWLWGENRSDELRQVLAVANETADSATRAVDAQSRQAQAQAEQNSRVAILLSELSRERQTLAMHVARFEETFRKDSEIAAALLALTPALVSGTALLLGTVALWAVTRPSPENADASFAMVQLLLEHDTAPHDAPDYEGRTPGRLRAQRERLPEPEHTSAEPPF